jgi:hypothetical protein
MWDHHYFAHRKIRRFERLLAGAVDAARRRVLTDLLGAARLKLLGPNAASVDPARLFHGGRKPYDSATKPFC